MSKIIENGMKIKELEQKLEENTTQIKVWLQSDKDNSDDISELKGKYKALLNGMAELKERMDNYNEKCWIPQGHQIHLLEEDSTEHEKVLTNLEKVLQGFLTRVSKNYAFSEDSQGYFKDLLEKLDASSASHAEKKLRHYKTPRHEGIIGDDEPFDFAGHAITKEDFEKAQREDDLDALLHVTAPIPLPEVRRLIDDSNKRLVGEFLEDLNKIKYVDLRSDTSEFPEYWIKVYDIDQLTKKWEERSK